MVMQEALYNTHAAEVKNGKLFVGSTSSLSIFLSRCVNILEFYPDCLVGKHNYFYKVSYTKT